MAAARELIHQGNRAIEKEITDPADGRPYRIHRWIVATTGTISPDAKRQIQAELARYGKPIAFWNGVKLGENILDLYYNEFIIKLQVPPIVAGQSNSVTNLYDADDPLVLASDFAATDWSRVDTSNAVPPNLTSGILISAKPVGESLPLVKLALKSSIDEILVDTFLSRANPVLLKLDEVDTHIEAMVIEGD